MSNNNISASEILSLSKKNPENLLNEVENKLSEEKKAELSRLLSDKDALERLMKSDKARQLFNQLKNNKQG